MNLATNKTFISLNKKIEDNSKRMPSVKAIHELLESLGVKHRFDGSVNTVEQRTDNKKYVDFRYDGKKGNKIEFRAYVKDIEKSPFSDFGSKASSKWFNLDSSNSYYSCNTWRYAEDLVALIENIDNFTFEVR